MAATVGVRELRQNLSRYLARVKQGETLTVTERGHEVAALIPRGDVAAAYADLVTRFGVTAPSKRLEAIAARLPTPGAAVGATDSYLSETRRERV